MTNTKHTPTPWKVEEQDTFAVVVGNDGKEITSSYDRDHAIKCVNMHDELVEALKEIMSEYATIVSNNFSQDVRLGGDDTYDLCVSTLKKAGAL